MSFWSIVAGMMRAQIAPLRTTLFQRTPNMTLVTTPPGKASQTAKAAAAKPPKQRDPEVTRACILEAAKMEFAKLGLAGTRVEAIATRSKANKRMIYHYFRQQGGAVRGRARRCLRRHPHG